VGANPSKSIFSKKEEHMGNAPIPPTNGEGQPTKRSGATTKRSGATTKRFAETMEAYSESGAYGDYIVATPAGKAPITITGAVTIRVLDHGELNLVTDTGRWYLFAPNAWLTASPTQPEPGKSGNN
jgi:hypothetical protein